MSEALQCWHCGAGLAGVILPLSRRQECEACGADQHVCLMCRHYNAHVADQCTEDRAHSVTDKERANFCDYFAPRPKAYRPQDSQKTDQAAAKLAELFGDAPPAAPADAATEPDSAKAARDALEDLFKKD